MTDRTIDDLRKVLSSQTFSELLGTRLTRYDDDEVTMELDIRPDFLQQHGYVHGGLLCYLADNALSFAGGRALGPNVLTSNVNITYLRPAEGDTLVARAHLQGGTSRHAVTQVEISVRRGDEEYLAALGSGTVSKARV